ncbi:class I SAM-dependent methyltransferase [Patescibacteria group bacterium]|nr:class I SAM-dependent methyltransferase [Patescibacteria group bacterium]
MNNIKSPKEIPHDWFQKGIESNFFQKYWHQKRFKLIIKELKKIDFSGDVLDAGCHSGDLTIILKKNFNCSITGMDLSKDAIGYAKQRFPSINFISGDISSNVPFRDNSFDFVSAFDVLEHIPNINNAIKELKRVLKPDGYLIVGLPAENIFFKVIWYFWVKLAAKNLNDQHVHESFEENMQAFVRAGFEKVTIQKTHLGMWVLAVFIKR